MKRRAVSQDLPPTVIVCGWSRFSETNQVPVGAPSPLNEIIAEGTLIASIAVARAAGINSAWTPIPCVAAGGLVDTIGARCRRREFRWNSSIFTWKGSLGGASSRPEASWD